MTLAGKLFKSRNPLPIPELPVTPGAARWIIVCLFLCVAQHLENEVPVWAVFLGMALCGWRYFLLVKQKPLPNRLVRISLALASFLGVILTFRSFMGRDPGIAALIILSSLKLLEMKSQRDFMFVVYLCYFLILGNFLYDQNIRILFFMVIMAVVVTAAVLRLNHGEKQPVRTRFLLKTALRYVLLSIPFMVVLFLFFPRSNVPLWNLAQGETMGQGVTGFSDSLEPGRIADLAQSNLPALRAAFPDDNMPPYKDLYFRGLLLWFTNGERWYQGILPSEYVRRQLDVREGEIQQDITLEPHSKRWLFALDTPASIPRGSRLYPGDIFQSYFPIKTVIRYGVVSTLKPDPPAPLERRHRKWGLMLPADWDSPIRDLGLRWKREAGSDDEIVEKGLAHFREGGFQYTLSPGTMDPDRPLEDFLFNKKRGFCEHFAATFCLLMRAAGVPARVALGYQGGEINEIGGYILVRQSDAHAWTEVWTESRGWHRIDPTGVVMPERIEFGAEMSRSLSSLGPMDEDDRSDAIRRAMRKSWFRKIFRFFEQHWDNINNKWEVWILTYNRFRQRNVLRDIGLDWMNRWSLLVSVAFITGVIFYLLTQVVRRFGRVSDPVGALYLRFLRQFQRHGLKASPWEGPLDFQLRAIDACPQKQRQIQQITGFYIKLKYGKIAMNKQSLKEFKKMVNHFKIKKLDL